MAIIKNKCDRSGQLPHSVTKSKNVSSFPLIFPHSLEGQSGLTEVDTQYQIKSERRFRAIIQSVTPVILERQSLEKSCVSREAIHMC